MVAAQLVEQEYIQALGKHILIIKQVLFEKFASNSRVLITIWLQPDGGKLSYFKLRLFDLKEFKAYY